MEPTDPENIPFATILTGLGILGLALAWRRRPVEAMRFAGVLFLFPIVYYFSHPEPYHMRPLDPLLILLGTYAIQTLRAEAQRAHRPQRATRTRTSSRRLTPVVYSSFACSRLCPCLFSVIPSGNLLFAL